MYINIVYPKKIPLFWVMRKSKRFFSQSEYTYRNRVFIHRSLDSVFSIDRNTIHIRLPNDDAPSKTFAFQYLYSVFGRSPIGITDIGAKELGEFNSLNYFLI